MPRGGARAEAVQDRRDIILTIAMTYERRPSTLRTPERRLWDQWLAAWHVLYYGILVWIGWCLRMPGALSGDGRSWADLGLAALGVWYGGMVLWRPGRRGARSENLHRGLYLAVALALFAALYRVHEIFLAVGWALAAQCFLFLPLAWAAVGALAVTAAAWWLTGVGVGLEMLSWLLSLAVPGLVAAWQKAMVRRSEERQALVETLAATRGELAAAERQAGILEERQRLAREIHDTVAQEFTSIVLNLEAAEGAANGAGGALGKHLGEARGAARRGLNEARRLVAALRPELLDGRSLGEALERLAERWSEESGVTARLQLAEEPATLSREVEATVLRAAQEALANVRKHAAACEVTVTFSRIGDLVVLDVQDDGRGFVPEEARPGRGEHFGLLGMRERAEQLGGRLLVESAPGEGTTVVLELPAP